MKRKRLMAKGLSRLSPSSRRRRGLSSRLFSKSNEYFIESIKSASLPKYAGYKDWRLVVRNYGSKKVALLGDKKELPLAKVLPGNIGEERFANSVLTDLVNNGLRYVVKKYGFRRYKSILEDVVFDKTIPSRAKYDRVSEGGIYDKRDFSPRSVDRSVVDDLTLDKVGRRRLRKSRSSLLRRKSLLSWTPLSLASRIRNRKRSGKSPLTISGTKNRLARKHRRAKFFMNYKNYLDIKKLANKVIEYYQSVTKLNPEKSRRAFVELFIKGKKAQDEAEEAVSNLEVVIEENVDVIDVPGLVEEVVNFMVEDEEMSPDETSTVFVSDFVVEDAPEEVVEEIENEVESLAEDVYEEIAEEREEKEEPATEGEGDEQLKKDLEEIEKGLEELQEEAPSAEETGIEDEIEVEARKKARKELEKFKKDFKEALKLAAVRQILNIEAKGLYNIKANLFDGLTNGSKIGGIKSRNVVAAIEQSFRKILSTNAIDEFIDSAYKLLELDKKAFEQIKKDTESLMPVDVLAAIGGDLDDSDSPSELSVVAKGETGLFARQDDPETLLKSIIPTLNFNKPKI